MVMSEADGASTRTGGAGVLRAEFDPRPVAVGAGLIRGGDVNLPPPATDLAGRTGVELAKRILAYSVTKGTADLFRMGKVCCRSHCFLQGGSALRLSLGSPPKCGSLGIAQGVFLREPPTPMNGCGGEKFSPGLRNLGELPSGCLSLGGRQ